MKRRYDEERSLFDSVNDGVRAAGLREGEIVVDSFAGGGGASLGIHWALGHGPHIAINHDKEAIALHAANHPDSKHYPEDVWHVDPVQACAGRNVGLMWLSPDCKHFSKAKGGKPVSKKIRGLAWTAVRWAKAVRPRVIILENVEEFQTWGPVLRATNRPDPKRKGHTFRHFVRRLERLGYKVEWRELRACDYGTPTIRKRLFLIARCDGAPIIWPTATHGKNRGKPWRTAAECIDWSLECPSIFTRKKELAENTLRRIARGIRRYVIDSPKPFIVDYRTAKRPGDDRTASVDAPLRTQTTENRFALAVPVIAGVGGRAGQSPERSVKQPFQTITAKGDAALVMSHITKFRGGATGSGIDEPMPTVTANSFIKRAGGCAPLGLVAAHVTPLTHHGENRGQSPDVPLATVTGAHRGEQALVAASLIQTGYGEDKHRNDGAGQPPRALDIEAPLGTVVGGGVKHALVSSFLAKHFTGVVGASLSDPMPTITSVDHNSLVASSLVHLRGSNESHLHGDDVDAPMRTISAGGTHTAEVRAFLTQYNGASVGQDVSTPVNTLPTHDRFGLVTVAGVDYVIADIGMRMLAPRELYRAQGFPDSYRIDIPYTSYYTAKGTLRKKPKTAPLSKTAQVRMCGNSVCPPLAAAIVRANVGRGYAVAPSHLDEIALEDDDRFEWLEAEDVA